MGAHRHFRLMEEIKYAWEQANEKTRCSDKKEEKKNCPHVKRPCLRAPYPWRESKLSQNKAWSALSLSVLWRGLILS